MASLRVIVVLALAVTLFTSPVYADDPVVEIKSGKLGGKSVEFSHSDINVQRTVHVFKGIPYAEPPVGDLRFQPPKPKVPWEGVHNAANFGSACMQSIEPLVPVQEPLSEDCLFLNVYAPQVDDSASLSVMVWIHGGAFIIGSGGFRYDGTALAATGDVIVVSINYRLGPFGFLATGDEHTAGNCGFYDQIAALRWVQDNIAAFGGDATKVTIFGESAGAISSEYLFLSPLTDGLFRRVILQSGSASLPGFVSTDTATQNKIAHGLGKLLGCDEDSSDDLVKCLRTVPSEDFIEPSDMSSGLLANVTGLDFEIESSPFPPVVDGKFVTETPATLIRERHFNKKDIDFMIGTLSDEGMTYCMFFMADKLNQTEVTMDRDTYEALYPAVLTKRFKNNPAVLDAIKLLYVNWEDADLEDADYVEAFSHMQGDQFFVCRADQSARAYSLAGAKVYVYQITHPPAKSIWPCTWLKAAHMEEIPFVFGWHFVQEMEWTMPKEDVDLAIEIMKYWTNFAKTGNPNSPCSNEDDSKTSWPQFKVPGLEYKALSPKMETKRALKAKECAFWNDFIPKLMKHTDSDSICSAVDDDLHVEKYKEDANVYPSQ